jgi:Protein of unknown function (DUF3147)
MSAVSEEAGITQRVGERPSVEAGQVREVKKRDLGYRFLAGALASLLSGGMTLAFGPRVGGVFLAFPAILAASLTLVEEQENSAEARENARGAVVGGIAMAVFAAIVAVTIEHMNPAGSLGLATVGWLAAAGLGYLVAWFK